MKKVFLLAFSGVLFITAFSQDAKFFYDQGLEKAQAGDLEKALQYLDKSIELKSDEYVAWYNRAIVKTMTGHYEGALIDLQQTIKLNPGYKKAYLNLGTTKKHLTDYNGALGDYTLAIALDSAYAEAFYYRGALYELLSEKSSACRDFTRALELGYKVVPAKLERCNDTAAAKTHSILQLAHQSNDTRYGFSAGKPVKVGMGPDGGPANERAYLELLRDVSGQPVKYLKSGSCCAYKSDNAPKGLAMIDKYEITYHDEKAQERLEFVYFTFYDYEEPLLLNGFKTVSPPDK